MGSKLYERELIVPLCADATSIAGVTTLESFKLDNYQRATLAFQFSAATDSSTKTLVLYIGTAAAATTSTVTYRYRAGSSAASYAGADVLGTEATSTALAIGTAYQGKMLVVDVTAPEVLAAGRAYATAFDAVWVTPTFAGSCSAASMMGFAILSDSRFKQATEPTAIT